MEPNLIERESGGWLALSPDASGLRIGVTAETADAARRAYEAARAAWQQLLDAAAATTE